MKSQSVPIIAIAVIVLLTAMVVTQPATARGCQDDYEPNDDNPQQLDPGQIQASICPKGDVDLYTFDVSTGDNVYISLTDLPADFDLSLYSSNEQDWVGISNNGSTTDEEIRWIADENDVLYIVVDGYDGATSTKPYTLTLRRFPKIDIDSKIADPSADLTPETRRQLQDNLTSEGFDNLLQVTKYMYNSQKCLVGIGVLLESLGAVLLPGTSEACAGAINQVNDIIQKYYNPPPLE